ncbi:MAG: winged helix-turn-helix transcriptional regulator [Armatimonadetes bacterium]|nr:winged helix-turn-helix transcriptional regulator [Armatimonadota bacterium]
MLNAELLTGDKGRTITSELMAKFFRGLGDPKRLKILELLLDRDRNVSELVSLLGCGQGRVSNHLACLRWCGYVTATKQGKFVNYRIKDGRIRELLSLARSIISLNARRILAGEEA